MIYILHCEIHIHFLEQNYVRIIWEQTNLVIDWCTIRLCLGILEKEQEQSVVYGSTDFGKTCATNEKYKELVCFIYCFIISKSKLISIMI